MKTKILNFLIKMRNILLIILVSGMILEVILRLLFSFLDKEDWRIYNYASAVIALLIVLMFLLPENQKEKDKKKRTRRTRSPWRIILFGRYVKVRPSFFFILGMFCLIYSVLSLFLFEDIENFNKTFRWLSVLFIPAYIFIYKGISALFFKPKKDFDYLVYNGFTWRDDVERYVLGIIGGFLICIIIGIIFLLMQGIVSLYKTYSGFLVLYLSLMLLIIFLSSKTIKK
jgi:hypothetical protein